MDLTAGQLSRPGLDAFPPHSIQNRLQPAQILLIHVLGQGLFGPFQLLRIGGQLAKMTRRPAPLAHPAVGIARVVAEDFPGLGPGRSRNPQQSTPFQMRLDQPRFKGLAVWTTLGQRLVRRGIHPRRGHGKRIQQAAAQAAQLGAGDRERRQVLGQNMEQRRALDQGTQQGALLA
jgi:hypothetical protein